MWPFRKKVAPSPRPLREAKEAWQGLRSGRGPVADLTFLFSDIRARVNTMPIARARAVLIAFDDLLAEIEGGDD